MSVSSRRNLYPLFTILVIWMLIVLSGDIALGFSPSGVPPHGTLVSRPGEPSGGDNQAPAVDAGTDLTATLPDTVFLDATVSDDGLPTIIGQDDRPIFVPMIVQSTNGTSVDFSDDLHGTVESASATDPIATSVQGPETGESAPHVILAPLTLLWTQVQGPGIALFESPNTEDTAVTFPLAGIYQLRLTASDGELDASDELFVIVYPVGVINQAPVVDAGGDLTVTLPAQAFVDATVSDDGLPGLLTFQWTQVDGPGTGATDPLFAFGAAGDHDSTENTAAVLDALSESDADFFLSLGDLSYTKKEPESAWCDFVKSHVGPDYPFELLVGNHEEQPDKDGFIDNYANCLPDRLGVTGLYAHRYTFDYPAKEPIARFILIDPNLYRGKKIAEYCKDGETDNCNWLTALIDEAKQQGLWTVVGMHKNCITAGVKPCEIGAELLEVLVRKRVDLILQGHEHIYERSKQLALNDACPSIEIGGYDAACVADDGNDGEYIADAGSTIVIVGVSGKELSDIPKDDPEVPYFAIMMGANRNPSYGFMKFDLSACTINAQFVNAVGDFQDSFLIKRSPGEYPGCEQVGSLSTVIQSPNTEDTAVAFSTPGSYRLSLTASDGELDTSDTVAIEVLNEDVPVEIKILDIAVAEGSDDAEEMSTGSVDLTSSDLELVYDGGSKETQIVGLRFADITIPQGATIRNAYIQFTTDETDNETTDLRLVAEDVDDSPPFQATKENISARDRTAATVSWQPSGWNVVGAQGMDQRSSGLAAPVQEVVDRPGWRSGNAIAIIITGFGKRVAESFEGNAGAAILHIEYQIGGPSLTVD